MILSCSHIFETIMTLDKSHQGTIKVVHCKKCGGDFWGICNYFGTIEYLRKVSQTERQNLPNKMEI